MGSQKENSMMSAALSSIQHGNYAEVSFCSNSDNITAVQRQKCDQIIHKVWNSKSAGPTKI
jgi:hypothetical protein